MENDYTPHHLYTQLKKPPVKWGLFKLIVLGFSLGLSAGVALVQTLLLGCAPLIAGVFGCGRGFVIQIAVPLKFPSAYYQGIAVLHPVFKECFFQTYFF